MIPRSHVLAVIAATAALAALPQAPPTHTLVPDLTIGGPDESREEYSFSAISGVAFDKSGRILVTDLKENTVKVYDAAGKFAYQFGRSGAGPGEFAGALSGVFSPDGQFWVRDESNNRWHSFELGPTRATARATVKYDHVRPFDRFAPVGFDRDRIVSSGSVRDEKDGSPIPLRTILDRSGRVIAADTIRVPKDSIGDFTIQREMKIDGRPSRVTHYYYQPYGASFAVAFAPNGQYARAASARYDIEWRDVNGTVIRRIRRDVQGPALSARERKAGQESVDEFLKRSRMSASELPQGVPARKAPIRALAFDQLGRLWVVRWTPDGTPREADVYDNSGKWVAIMRWPANINPSSTNLVAVQGNHVLAIARDTADFEAVVRLIVK